MTRNHLSLPAAQVMTMLSTVMPTAEEDEMEVRLIFFVIPFYMQLYL